MNRARIKPKVSVAMITYGHEKYIKEAIEGVLMQVCDFEVELIVADDKSPDSTEVVVMDIIRNHPNGHWLKYTRHGDNKGMMPNFIWSLAQCKGKYIALCEGDDYWTDPLKLQKQVGFLDKNLDFSFSMGRVDMLIEKTKEIRKRKEVITPNKEGSISLRGYLKGPVSQTSSFVFRNDKSPFPEWFSKVHAGDQSLVIIKVGLNDKIKYHKECMSIYRLNNRSVTFQAKYDVYEKFLKTLNIWQKHLNFEYKNIFILRRYKTKTESKYRENDILLRKGYIQLRLGVINALLKII